MTVVRPQRVSPYLTLRAPGMSMFRMPIVTWNILVTALMVAIVFPLLAAALLAAMADRMLGAHVFAPPAVRCCGSSEQRAPATDDRR